MWENMEKAMYKQENANGEGKRFSSSWSTGQQVQRARGKPGHRDQDTLWYFGQHLARQ